MVTDVGIEIGKLIYWNRSKGPAVQADLARLRVLVALVAFFFTGAVIGALGFKHVGYSATIPLAVLLVAMASMPAIDDLAALTGD